MSKKNKKSESEVKQEIKEEVIFSFQISSQYISNF